MVCIVVVAVVEYPTPVCLFSISPLHSCTLEAWLDLNSPSLEELSRTLRGRRGLSPPLLLPLKPLFTVASITRALQEHSQPPLLMLFKNHRLGIWERPCDNCVYDS
ncbi:hypothetical protein CFP56_040905 [Quercus suber]|uniref:Uncharacterized protein n=1 Tax=Quercus suber TaxID=58331 RepID=A0AAW0IXF4_QUESU